MSAVGSRLRGHWTAAPAASPAAQPLALSAAARLHYGAVLGTAAALSAYDIGRLPTPVHGWEAFAVFTLGATVAQLFIVEAGRNQSYRTAIAFLVAAAVVLQPGFIPMLVVVHYIPGWIKYGKRWLVMTFNIGNTILATLAAAEAFHAISSSKVTDVPAARYALAGVTACAVWVVVNHVLLARMIELTSEKSMLATGLFSFESVSTDFGVAAVGIGVAAFWSVNAWLMLFVLGPLLIIHRALYVPQLRELAQIDAKTGLLNAKEFERILEAEVARAARTATPLSLLMVDLDLLREINNKLGHLAGDVVIGGVADVFREQLRRYDVPSRFGGDEFCVLLPETARAEAQEIAERLRQTVAARQFTSEVLAEPVRATVSIGIATWPDDAFDPKALLHHADLAAYRVKEQREETPATSPA